MENLKQSLLEQMADWLDSGNTQLEMNLSGMQDHEDLHLKMADAAFEVFLQETTKGKV